MEVALPTLAMSGRSKVKSKIKVTPITRIIPPTWVLNALRRWESGVKWSEAVNWLQHYPGVPTFDYVRVRFPREGVVEGAFCTSGGGDTDVRFVYVEGDARISIVYGRRQSR